MRCIIVKYSLVAVWMKVLVDEARTSHLWLCQLRLQERQSSDMNDESLLVGKPVAPRPDEYVGLDLTRLDVKTFTVCMSGIMRHIGDNLNTLGMMQVTRPSSCWDCDWVWDRRWGRCLEVEVRTGLKAWLHLIENWSLINRMIRPLIVQ